MPTMYINCTSAGASIPLQHRRNSPQPGKVLREGQGVVPQSAPTRSPNEIFVEYNWISSVKIVVLLVNYFQN